MTLPLETCFVHQFIIFVKAIPISKIALVFNSNEKQPASSFQGWIIGICIFQVLSVTTCSFSYTLVENLSLEKMYI